MKAISLVVCFIFLGFIMACEEKEQDKKSLEVEVIETSASGNKLTKRTQFEPLDTTATIVLKPEKEFQTITGLAAHLQNLQPIYSID